MSKIKLACIAVAIVVGIGGAFATKPCALCETQQQYIKFQNGWIPVGEYGTDYICSNSAGTCTWVQESPYLPNSFVPCRTGQFSWIFLK